MKNIVAITLLILSAWSLSLCVRAQPAAETYALISPPQPTQTTAGKIEVLEIFWYGCPHCYDFEPHLREWLKRKPANVEFRLLPGTLGRNWIPHAKAYYTAVKLGVLDRIHAPLFDAIHKERRELFTDDAIKAFFIEQGVDGHEFSTVYDSREVWEQILQVHEQLKNYRITGVPSVIINGKYLTGPGMVPGHEELLEVMDELVETESRSAQDP
jgi:thiol:disulfide interchange protein DsbA